jgi:hypothetical protein
MPHLRTTRRNWFSRGNNLYAVQFAQCAKDNLRSGFIRSNRLDCSGTALHGHGDKLTLEKAEDLLASFDKEQQLIAKTQGEGMGGGTSAAR